MSDPGFLKRLEDAARLSWEGPPPAAGRHARRMPSGEPSPPPPAGSPEGTILPEDIRAGALLDPTGIIQRSLPGIDVTVSLQPPQGDELWSLHGRAWPREEPGDAPADEPIRVLLVQGEHVLAEQEFAPGGRFQFADVLVGRWALEFRWGDRIAVLRDATG